MIARTFEMSWFPLREAVICLDTDCSAIWRDSASQPTCPACGSHKWWFLSTWLDRRLKERVA